MAATMQQADLSSFWPHIGHTLRVDHGHTESGIYVGISCVTCDEAEDPDYGYESVALWNLKVEE